MSYLWATAAAAQLEAAWWNNQREHEYEGDDEYPLRDPAEKLSARRNRYTSQIVDRHNVTRRAASEALKHVVGHLKEGAVFKNPTEYGFASSADQDRHYPHEVIKKLQDDANWKGRPVQQIPTDEIHATQNFIRPSSVAHNLFWPGHRQPSSDEAAGDPDYEPESENERDDDEFSGPEERELHRTAKFMEHPDGRIECVDGHHRAGADIILGKKTTPGQLIQAHELMRPPASREIDWPRSGNIHEHLMKEHGFGSHIPELYPTFSHADHAHDEDHWSHQDEMDHHHP